ncbi:MAG TPA: type 4a pilus biogenesis protein PilO [Acidobacteriota bacterium]|nr:type 4a pilus biogenesis protein PilO [Acidobacteriota bacterium]
MGIRDYRFENLPRSVQVAIFAAFVGCLAFVFYMYYLKDQIQQNDVIQKEIAKLERTVAQGTAIENQLKRFKQELAQLEERLAVLRSILPSEKETPAVLRSVQKMAAASNLKINRFIPKPVAPRAFYSDWPIHVEVEGNYDGLGLFFEKVSQATRIIDVADISIAGMDKPPADPNTTLTASCTATTFVYREDQAPAPAPEAKPKKKEKKR